MQIIKISGAMKEYPWGSPSFIQRLLEQENDKKSNSEEKLVGELWLGTHPNGPSFTQDGISLDDFLKSNPSLLGKHSAFPFLLKVMAIEKPLSIQVHPTTQQAIEGYKNEENKRKIVHSDVLNYQDSNEKAEMLYAISPMTAMLGFTHIAKIQEDLKRLLGTYYQDYFATCDNISSIFHTLYTIEKKELSLLIEKYKENLNEEDDIETSHPNFLTPKEIALTAIEDYNVDPGVFAPYLLNVVHLEPKESIYLSPQIVHAYVKGEGIELMTNSDNILRAGLTNKHMDVEELMKIMIAKETKVMKLTSSKKISGTHINTPNNVFELAVLEKGTYTMNDNLLSIILVTQGRATIISKEETVTLTKGMSAYISPTFNEYTIATDGIVFRAMGK